MLHHFKVAVLHPMAKRARCIDSNDYPGTNTDWRGCVNGANDWAKTLTDRSFTVSQLLDGQATKAALVAGVEPLIRSAPAAPDASDAARIRFPPLASWLPAAVMPTGAGGKPLTSQPIRRVFSP